MKGSGIGGQAVMEGVMMKNGDKYAVAVRKPDNEIAVDVQEHKALGSSVGLNKIPIVRGVLAFIDSLILGVGTLTYSASFFEDEEDLKKEAKLAELDEVSREAIERKDALKEKAMMTGTVLLSVVLAVGIFMLLPYFLSQLLRKVIESQALLAFLEGILRVALFIGYVAAISLMKDIKRVFMYHGAEHKSINCIENGLPLTVENVRTQSRHHKRCGTSFLLIVMLISVLFFMFIQTDSAWLRLVLRLVLIPVIAGISYEFIRIAGRKDNKLVNILSKPGMALQNLTTAEPDDSMIECAIASVEAVFDWKEFLEKFDEEPSGSSDIECCNVARDEDKLNNSKNNSEKKTDSKKAESKMKSKKSEPKQKKEKNPAPDESRTAETEPVEAAEPETESETKKTEEIPVQKEWEPFADKDDDTFTAKKSSAETGKAEQENADAAVTEERQQAVVAETTGKKGTTEVSGQTAIDVTAPIDDEDDEILKALDKYFILKQKKDNEQK